MSQQRTPASDRFLRLPGVQTKTGLSRTSIYTLEDFPAPIKLTERAVAWRESDRWMAARPKVSGPSKSA